MVSRAPLWLSTGLRTLKLKLFGIQKTQDKTQNFKTKTKLSCGKRREKLLHVDLQLRISTQNCRRRSLVCAGNS